MKGIARTQKEIEFHDRVAQLGCISCRQEGNYNPWVSIHHAHGRTKPGCHMWVLPLCEPHHQDNGTAIARHPYKRRWEAKYGNEDDLIRAMWTELGVEFTEPVRVAKPVDRDRPKRATSESAEVGVVKLREIKPKVDKPVKAKIPSAKPLQASVNKPTLPKSKISSPAKPKAKIQNAGFTKSSKGKNTPKFPPTKTKSAFITQSRSLQNSVKSQASIDFQASAKAAAKIRQAAYLEENKEIILARKMEAKALKKRQLAEFKSGKKVSRS